MNYLKKELYELVKSKEEIFDFIQESSLDGLWYWDVEKPENEWMNPKFWTTLGYDPAEMPHKASAWRAIIHPGDLKIATENFIKHCENTDHPYDQVVRYTHKDGSTVWIRCRGMAIRDSAGKAVRMLGAHIDITKEKENEERIRSQKTLMQSSIESYKGFITFSIDKAYRYIIFNADFKEATDQLYDTDIVLGMNMLDSITNTEDREKAKKNCDRALSGESHTTIEVYGDLNQSYFETKYSPIIDSEGNIIGAAVLSADITERKLAEEHILTLNKELEAFSYSIAHDLRAPLRIINGYAEVLIEDSAHKLDDEDKRLINVISANARHMGALVDDLLKFSRLGRQPVKKHQVNMVELVQSVTDELRILASKEKGSFKIGVLHPLYCDSGLIRQVMSNLISNGIKYSQEKENPVVEIGSEKNGQTITYFVKDNGVGFDMKYADKLFKVFQRLHKAADFEGTGVGLAIVERIIAKHGGEFG